MLVKNSLVHEEYLDKYGVFLHNQVLIEEEPSRRIIDFEPDKAAEVYLYKCGFSLVHISNKGFVRLNAQKCANHYLVNISDLRIAFFKINDLPYCFGSKRLDEFPHIAKQLMPLIFCMFV